MDMDKDTIKGVWGLNGRERPGAVYLAAVLAGHAQKGLPAFGIYGHDVQDLDDNSIPEDVAEKILRFARAAQAVATMRGKSYLSMGSVSMGSAGSIVNPDFFQEYLGMRNESVDQTEIIRRMEEGIYDHEEYEKAMEDDFNTADAISAIFELVKLANSNSSSDNSKEYIDTLMKKITTLTDILGLKTDKKEEMLDEDIEALIAERQQARKDKNFARADEIRDELLAKGIVLKDTREGVRWSRA